MKLPYQQILGLQRMYFADVVHAVTVRKINNRYHCRVFTNGILNQEAFCLTKDMIGLTCRRLLRMEDKCGNSSKYAHKARMRQGEKEYKRYVNETNNR